MAGLIPGLLTSREIYNGTLSDIKYLTPGIYGIFDGSVTDLDIVFGTIIVFKHLATYTSWVIISYSGDRCLIGSENGWSELSIKIQD